ncbi:MAG: triose-phosphate isomerase [Gammaproteobacteria bacterium RIFCSPLOWO2_02_FULL_42_14]|nr:MAG: triose-phosphate isomerase [Gammaproteobacteria bacterium RIFCSPHIGHO2_02_FULL_42_43]OGT28864.1 MAG: triose-phosphate isomerase [Gammaproteobacteria bacterium RIFCSPHIGHO2_01_FULL_42_8]OGT52982.1 MAG: triose-phosphate isomerase [Gammaproteobacteria bacterium RIFCSPHIGHO2_12_FULL_41_25]OGT61246.1 MAG: triose-phosphate isomerase [Gammaproteobacteria bacterium RIFCSPLOWO2_02_FULL_42_14]OGT87173.1 MAG: triose-phosphate isomerase [Gammaproteobacteria bacterium RIFCSPLOWO2_12_FULL_42_18]
MRRSFIAGNWKMNGTLESARLLLQILRHAENEMSHIDVAVFPPFVHLSLCRELLLGSRIAFGAQTVSMHADGAYTGEISAAMLKELGCAYVIIGHSERRQYFGEDNATLEKQCIAAIRASLVPIFCVGETLAQREANQTLSVVQEQLAVVQRLKDNCDQFCSIVIAYEPVWAIGTGKVATPEQAESVHAVIRQQLADQDKTWAMETRILYGGSVKPDNAAALFAMDNIDGALVGGASLDAAQFLKIGHLCNNSF